MPRKTNKLFVKNVATLVGAITGIAATATVTINSNMKRSLLTVINKETRKLDSNLKRLTLRTMQHSHIFGLFVIAEFVHWIIHVYDSLNNKNDKQVLLALAIKLHAAKSGASTASDISNESWFTLIAVKTLVEVANAYTSFLHKKGLIDKRAYTSTTKALNRIASQTHELTAVIKPAYTYSHILTKLKHVIQPIDKKGMFTKFISQVKNPDLYMLLKHAKHLPATDDLVKTIFSIYKRGNHSANTLINLYGSKPEEAIKRLTQLVKG